MAELVNELQRDKTWREPNPRFSDAPILYDGDAYANDAKATDVPDYKKVAERLSDPDAIELFHCVIGKVTEIGELADALKKFVMYGKPIDWINVVEELGDDQWYTGIGSLVTKRVLGIGLTDIQKLNITKLKDRYPDKFTEEKALNRDLERERKTLEGLGREGKAGDGQGTSH